MGAKQVLKKAHFTSKINTMRILRMKKMNN